MIDIGTDLSAAGSGNTGLRPNSAFHPADYSFPNQIDLAANELILFKRVSLLVIMCYCLEFSAKDRLVESIPYFVMVPTCLAVSLVWVEQSMFNGAVSYTFVPYLYIYLL